MVWGKQFPLISTPSDQNAIPLSTPDKQVVLKPGLHYQDRRTVLNPHRLLGASLCCTHHPDLWEQQVLPLLNLLHKSRVLQVQQSDQLLQVPAPAGLVLGIVLAGKESSRPPAGLCTLSHPPMGSEAMDVSRDLK